MFPHSVSEFRSLVPVATDGHATPAPAMRFATVVKPQDAVRVFALAYQGKLSALAALAGLSQSHCCRAFKASTGPAPYQWQLQSRVDRAKFLLLNTNRCLQEIAEETGFAHAVHVGRTFRKMTGVSRLHGGRTC